MNKCRAMIWVSASIVERCEGAKDEISEKRMSSLSIQGHGFKDDRVVFFSSEHDWERSSLAFPPDKSLILW